MDNIFNYKNSLTTKQMGFDTIEINLVVVVVVVVIVDLMPHSMEVEFVGGGGEQQ